MGEDIIVNFAEGWTWGWVAVGAIATCVLAGGVFFAFYQVRQTRKSTNAQIAVELFRELHSEETENALRFIYQLSTEDVKHLCRTDLNKIDRVIDKFELIGALVNQRIVDEHLAIEAFAGPPALRCWYQLAPYIREQDKKRGVFQENYEDFVRRTVEYFENEKIEPIFSK